MTTPDPLEVVNDDGVNVTLLQPDFADAWVFEFSTHGCLNFGQYSASDAIGDWDIEPRKWRKDPDWLHVCDIDLLIAMLQQVKREQEARRQKK